MSMLMFFLSTLIVAHAELMIEPVPTNIPAFFTKLADAHISFDSIAMIYHIDLAEYYNLTKIIGDTIELANEVCREMAPGEICKAQVSQLNRQLQNALADDENMTAMRQRRGLCNWCGKLQGFLYGIMTEDDGKQIVNAINTNGNETQQLHNLTITQSKLFRASLDINRKQITELQNVLTQLENQYNNIASNVQKQSDNQFSRSRINALAQLAESVLSEHLRVYSQLTRALSDAKNHRIPELIPLNVLSKDLKSMSTSLKPSQRLPTDLSREQLAHVFGYGEVKTLLIENNLLIQIIIPIAETEQYELHRFTPIPITTPNGKMVLRTRTHQFLLSNDKTKFIEVNERELENARISKTMEMLLRPAAAIQLKHNTNCIWSIFVDGIFGHSTQNCEFKPIPRTDLLITIIENEKYFISSENGTTIWQICHESQQHRAFMGNGVITLDPDCYMKTPDFILKPHLTTKFNQTHVLKMNLAVPNTTMTQLTEMARAVEPKMNLTISKPTIIANAHDMDQLIEQADQLIDEANHHFKWQQLELKTHDLSFNFWSFATIAGFVSISIFVTMAIFACVTYKKFNIVSTILSSLGFSPKLTKEGGVIINLADYQPHDGQPTPHPARKSTSFQPSAPNYV